MSKIDFTKELRQLYAPPTGDFAVVDVPPLQYLMLDGAGEMDRHFRQTSLSQNAPVLAAFADLYYTQVRHAETRDR